MGVFQKSLLALVAITLFLPLSNAEDNIYRVDGLPSDLHYSTGTVYELQITANDYDSIAAVTVGVTNGTLSLTNDFGADSADRFNLSSSSNSKSKLRFAVPFIGCDMIFVSIFFR